MMQSPFPLLLPRETKKGAALRGGPIKQFYNCFRETVTAQAQDLNLLSLNLDSLTGADALNHDTLYAQAGTGGDLLHKVLAELLQISHNLNILDCRSVIKGDEVHGLAAAFGSYPSFNDNLLTEIGTLKKVNNPCSLDIHCFRFNL